MRSRVSLLALLLTFFMASQTIAQTPPTAAFLVHSEGDVYLSGEAVEANAAPAVLTDTVVLRTGQGRAAVALKHGGSLFLDARSSVRVLGNGTSNFNRIEVLTGSAIVASETSTPIVECEDEMRLSNRGVFRFDVQPVNSSTERFCQFRVFAGAAAVPLVSVTSELRAGQSMMCNRRCGDMIQTTEFSPAQLDDFDRWARRMHERFAK